jgi:hypothetical protein
MSGYLVSMGEHLSDGALMELVDGASSPASREHLIVCDECNARMIGLEKAAALLRASLPDVLMPNLGLHQERSKRRATWVIPIPLAIAASVLLLVSAAAATPAVRNWIAHRFAPADPHAVSSPSKVTTARPPAVGIVASFVPTDSVLAINIQWPQLSGAVQLVGSSGEKVSAQAVGHIGEEELIVMPAAIQVLNGATSIADYRIIVPASVRTIRVIIAGKETTVVVNDGRLDRRIPLR